MATKDWQLSGFYFYSHRRQLVNVLQVFYVSFKKYKNKHLCPCVACNVSPDLILMKFYIGNPCWFNC